MRAPKRLERSDVTLDGDVLRVPDVGGDRGLYGIRYNFDSGFSSGYYALGGGAIGNPARREGR